MHNTMLNLKVLLTGMCLIIASIASECAAQQLILDTRITASYENMALSAILKDMETTSNIHFSYSANKIPVDTKCTATFTNTPLSEVLKELFKDLPIRYELNDNYIILKKGEIPSESQPKKSEVRKFTINGFIKDNESGELLIGAAIYIKELLVGAISNSYGYFSVTLPPGKYTLIISYIGYEAKEQTIELITNTKFDIAMQPALQLMKEVVINNATQEETQFKTYASQSEILPDFIKKQPALLGESDVLKTLEKQPGITYFADGSSYFNVRGGNYDQNLILLDEATLYNPSHLLGIFSPIIPEAVKSVDIYKAGFPVNYGGRLSSVIDIRTNDGNMNEFNASGSLSLLALRGTLEGPIRKGKSSYFITFRRSYFDRYFKRVAPNLKNLYFTDFTAKMNFNFTKNDRLSYTIYRGKDIFRIREGANVLNGIDWGNTSATIRWNHIFGSRLFLNSTFFTSKYNYYLRSGINEGTYWNSRIVNASLKEELTFFATPRLTWRFGFRFGFYDFNPGNYYSPDNPDNVQVSPVHSFEVIYYGGADHEVLPWLALHYGLRFTKWSDYGESFVVRYDENHEAQSIDYYQKDERFYQRAGIEPRFSASAKLSKKICLKTSYSRTSQYINLITNSISPFNSFEVWMPAGPNIKPQYADIVDLGYLQSGIFNSLGFQADVYYKWLYNQIGYEYHANMLVNPLVEGELRQGKGWAYGVEVALKKEQGRFQSQLAYTYSRSFLKIEELNDGHTFPAVQDRPHVLNLCFTWQAKPRWQITCDLNYSSGARITTPTSFYYYRGYQVPVFSEQNNDRLPPYSRFDIASTIQLNKKPGNFEHSLSFSIYNLFAQQNPMFLYFNKTEEEDGSLIIPADRLNQSDLVTSVRYAFILIPSITYQFIF
jgi:hypothetical protein